MLHKGLAACLALGSYMAAFWAGADEIRPARYLLSAGREFTFHSESTSEGKANDSVYLVDWKVWSLGRDPDGARRLVIRCDLRIKQVKGPQPAQNDDIETLVWRCRMFDDGRFFGATTMGTVRDPFRLFPKLPQARRSGKGLVVRWFRTRRRYFRAPSETRRLSGRRKPVNRDSVQKL